MRKIILDTDIGSDIDDCFALAYLLSRSDVEILGITTVSGAAGLRARLADKVCSLYGKNVPVCVGNEKSLDGEIRQPRLTKAQNAVSLSNEKEFADLPAADFMKNIIEKNSGEVTLVCIGQLTNIATLFLKYPDVAGLLKGMVIMGGRYAESKSFDLERWGKTEWNILCDIKAAQTVFERCAENSIVVGIEQTCRFSCPSALMKKAFRKKQVLGAVADCISATAVEVYFHDAIAVYAWLNRDEVALERGNITVETSNDKSFSGKDFIPSDKGKCLVLTDFSPEKFFADYKRIVGINP